jgi:pyridoxamine 5'-phosphate oxidase
MSTTTFPIDYVPSPDPFVEFELWMKKAKESKDLEPTAMHLSTISQEQKPRGRIVLYKGMSHGGLTFYTNYESNKAHEIEFQPHVAVTFHWKILELQLRVEGKIQKTSRQESEAYFATRPRESQIGAWVSAQSRVLKTRKDMDQKKIELEEKFKGRDIPCPPFWGGYRITPDLFEFWMCEPGRLHNRFQYTKDLNGWKQERLFP